VDVTSRFKGGDYRGGKGTQTVRGTHVPLIVNWPGKVAAGGVNADLVSSVDFLPTVCEAAGVSVPSALNIDGRSIFPQILGQKGNPRESLYVWYARYGGPMPMFEFAMSKRAKLYRDGTYFDLSTDRFEEKPLKASELRGAAAEEAKKLQAALDHPNNVRPARLLQHTPRSNRPQAKREG
jgi:arylsulfatase A